MINICEKKDCCGCGACVQKCPSQCIRLVVDEEGFWYPQVNEAKCSQCGACERTCPIFRHSDLGSNERMIGAYAAYAKNDSVRYASSSGGIFTLLAYQILKEKGIVYGAAFADDMSVKHIGITKFEDMDKLQGSKYVQSDLCNTYLEIKSYLQQGRQILFSGTACQVSGLNYYLGKEYPNLVTIDVLCHGVPSPKVWQMYLKEQVYNRNATVKRISFRNKKYGWKKFSLLFEFSDGSYYESVFNKDAFMKMFLNNISLRPSCYSCKFKGLDRLSDITLGDCWGIENYMPEMDDDVGTSIALIHSDKGLNYFNKIKQDMVYCQVDVERALPASVDSRKSVDVHRHRKRFMNYLKKDVKFGRLLKAMDDTLCDRVKYKIQR